MNYKKIGRHVLFPLVLLLITFSNIDVFAKLDCEKNISLEEVAEFFNFDSISWRKWKAATELTAFYQFQGVDSRLKLSSPAYRAEGNYGPPDPHPWVIHPNSFMNAPARTVVVDVTLAKDVKINGVTCYKGAKIGELSVYYQAGDDNEFYSDPICTNFREKYKNKKKQASLVVPACYVKYATNLGETSREIIEQQQRRFEKQLSGKPTAKLANMFSDEQTTSDVKNPGALQCGYYDDEKKSVTKTHVDEKTENSCYKKCKEAVTVTFDPPIETQSGMCFEYVTEIKSTVECVTEYLKAPPAPPIACYDQPECKHKNNLVGAQAGPNEEFDQCVNKCDNGKYSQKCIDKCYKEVYVDKTLKDVKTKISNDSRLSYQKNNIYNNRDITIRKVAQGQAAYDVKTCKIGYEGTNEWYSLKKVPYDDPQLVAKLVEFKQLYPGGYVKQNTLQWKQSEPCSSNLAAFYFQDEVQTKSTLTLLQDDTSNWHAENGFLKLGNCGADCKFSLCDDTGSDFKEKMDDYNAALEQWKSGARDCGLSEEMVEQCLVDSSKCSGTTKECNDDVGTYEITVDEKTEYAGEDHDYNDLYEAKQKQNSKNVTDNFWNGNSMDNGLNKGSIVKDTTGICMGGTYVGEEGSCTAETQKTQPDCTTDNQALLQGNDSCTCYDYRDLLTFPKNYINNKTGQTTNTPSSELGMTDIGDQYCTRLTTKNTNVDWYNWKVYGDGSLPTGEEKSAIENNTNMNIKVKIRNYGYFGWNFDVSCFYALIQNPLCEETGTCSCEETGTCPNDTDVVPVTNDLIFRTIDLDNVFIRDARYNWNCNGTNLENENYIVQPTTLIKDIEKKSDSIYSDDNELDYKFHLDVDDITRIKKYNEENKDFLQTSGNSTVEEDGLSIYKSPFLDEFSDIIEKRGIIGCNNASGNSCTEKITSVSHDDCYQEYMADKGEE